MKWLLGLSLLLSSSAFAQYNSYENVHFMELNKLSLELNNLKSFKDNYWDEYGQPKEKGKEYWKNRAGSTIDFNLVRIGEYSLFLEATVWGAQTQKEVRASGLDAKAGIHLGPKIDIFRYYSSGKLADSPTQNQHPLYDWYGISYKIYERTK